MPSAAWGPEKHVLNHNVGLCVFGGWVNWPHLAQLESGGVGLHTCGVLANQCTTG